MTHINVFKLSQPGHDEEMAHRTNATMSARPRKTALIRRILLS
jgi:hypothetical protein